MIYLYGFLICGTICLIGELLYQLTKLTPGHIVSLFVIAGGILEAFNLYRYLIKWGGAGASLPITSFGYLLTKGSVEKALNTGNVLGVFTGVFDKVGAGIGIAIASAFIVSLFFKSKS